MSKTSICKSPSLSISKSLIMLASRKKCLTVWNRSLNTKRKIRAPCFGHREKHYWERFPWTLPETLPGSRIPVHCQNHSSTTPAWNHQAVVLPLSGQLPLSPCHSGPFSSYGWPRNLSFSLALRRACSSNNIMIEFGLGHADALRISPHVGCRPETASSIDSLIFPREKNKRNNKKTRFSGSEKRGR